MRSWRHRAALPALLSALALAGVAAATEIIPQSPEEMGRAADLVVRGRVESVRSYWNEAHTRILTEATVAVRESYKGREEASVRVVQMGGTVDDVRMTVAGALAWSPGEEVLLFLERSLPERFRVAGFSQGKYVVERDPATGVEVLSSAGLDGLELGAAAAGKSTRGGRERLDDFLARLRPVLEGGR